MAAVVSAITADGPAAQSPDAVTTGDRQERDALVAELDAVATASLRLAIEDLSQTFPDRYRLGPNGRRRLAAFERRRDQLRRELLAGSQPARVELAGFLSAFRHALLANPLLDVDRIVLVRRQLAAAATSDTPRDWGVPLPDLVSRDDLRAARGTDELAVLSQLRGAARLETLYKPPPGQVVCDINLHWDADRLLFSSTTETGRWAVFELRLADRAVRQLAPKDGPDAECYQAVYLPDGAIAATAIMPVNKNVAPGFGSPANLYRIDVTTGVMRRLTVEHAPEAMTCLANDGRLLYLRGRAAAEPPEFARILFCCDPAGAGQREYFGGRLPVPASLWFARPLPEHPTRLAAVVDWRDAGSTLRIFDSAESRGLGRSLADGHGDPTTGGLSIRWLHPRPLSDKYYLAAARQVGGLWGIYLLDVFGNRTLLKELTGSALFEPVPLRRTLRPPTTLNKLDPDERQVTVYLHNVYAGPGLEGIPRGKVKHLRVLAFPAAQPPVRILGTVPVRDDGSVMFRTPAWTPISVQPLDEHGRALQQMRSTSVGLPGEMISCIGCHEPPTEPVPRHYSLSARGRPAPIRPWYGPARPFRFSQELQPVLDKHCITCHSGDSQKTVLDLTAGRTHGEVSAAERSLLPYVLHPLAPGDRARRVLSPTEFCANTCELVQLLEKGHYDVVLDGEAWDRLYTWIDVSAAGVDWNDLAGHDRGPNSQSGQSGLKNRPTGGPESPRAAEAAEVFEVPGWPFDVAEARRRQQAAMPVSQTIELGQDPGGQPVALKLVKIPAGEFVLGNPRGTPDERQTAWVRISKPYWMTATEITNSAYRLFDPVRLADRAIRDPDTGRPDRPVVRVSWQETQEFCRWLSQKTGREFRLPSEAQWEWAARCGSATPFWFGATAADYSPHANLADRALGQPLPHDPRFDDGAAGAADVGRYQPNPWGLYDMHGNVAEWTQSDYRPFPYDSRLAGTKVVRGGSWRDRPHRATASFRLAYRPYQRVFDVGFRVVCDDQ
jgi:formylglycine-generating enzyme required for sulfatase activity